MLDQTEQRARGATFEAFYRQHYRRAVRLAYLLSGSALISEDIAQDAFIAIERRFDTIEHPAAYLRTTVIRTSVDYHRRERRHSEARPELFDDRSMSDPDRELVDVLARLPDAQRIVITLRYWLGMTFPEIAAATSSRLSTTKSHARRGLASMRKELEP